jgi:hypothetical protein
MTKHKGKTGLIDVKELLQRDEDFLRAALQALAQAALEAVLHGKADEAFQSPRQGASTPPHANRKP